MEYSQIQNPKIKAIIDNLKHQSYSVRTDVHQAFDLAGNEAEFIEDAIIDLDNLQGEIKGMIQGLKEAGEA